VGANLDDVGFAFLDPEKEVYLPLYPALLTRLFPGSLLTVDNVLSHAEALGPFVNTFSAAAAWTPRSSRWARRPVYSPGQGLGKCRKWGGAAAPLRL